MAVREERRAVLLLAVLAGLGGAMRIALRPDGPPGAPVIAPELAGEDVARQAALSRRAEALARPLLPGERVDVDGAGADELERLPRIGRELSRRIVEERDARGPFGSLQGLRRVSGIGPAMLAALEGSTRFSGVPRPQLEAPGGATGAAVSGAMQGGRAGVPPSAECAGTGGPVSLNRATVADLVCVRGIGPALAARIVADRDARGPYRRLEDLDRVRGIGARLLERLRPYVLVP